MNLLFWQRKFSVGINYDFMLAYLYRSVGNLNDKFYPKQELDTWWKKNIPYSFKATMLGSWARQALGATDSNIDVVEILFKTEADALMFRLKWL
jgi:hypothetical protein